MGVTKKIGSDWHSSISEARVAEPVSCRTALAGDRKNVDAALTTVRELDPEDALARELVHDLRHDHVAISREVRADLHRVLGLEAEIHLLRDAQLELVEHHDFYSAEIN